MPSVTINIAAPGTQLSNGDVSHAGHMWYSLTDSNGNTASYGFSPDANHEGQPIAPGQVNAHGSDNNFYQSPEYSKTIEITQSQYDAMKAFGDNPAGHGFDMQYNGLNNSCVDFVWKGLQEGGMNPSILEHFNGRTFRQVPTGNSAVTVAFSAPQMDLLNQSYAALKDSVYQSLVQSRLKPQAAIAKTIIIRRRSPDRFAENDTYWLQAA
jgi:hypothetical protein